MTDFNKPPAPDESGPTGGYAAPPPPPPVGGYGTPAPPPYGAPAGGAPVTESDERLWAMLAHIGGIVIGWISGLIVYLIYKDRSQYLKQQGAEALNFQITITILYLIAYVITTATLGLGFVVIFVPLALQIIFGIIAGLAANKHENYRYPFAIRLVK